MKFLWLEVRVAAGASPLAEGRELKYIYALRRRNFQPSPLAEGRELKYLNAFRPVVDFLSPLAEGRELKCVRAPLELDFDGRPSRRGVN